MINRKEVKSIWFDWGNVLLPIDPKKTTVAFRDLNAPSSLRNQTDLFRSFEKGTITNLNFLDGLKEHIGGYASHRQLTTAWNALLGEMPVQHMDVLKTLKKDYQLVLVSNTNALHLDAIRKCMGPFNFKKFMAMFEHVFLSFEMGERKPDANFFSKALQISKSEAAQCYLWDDTAVNIDQAEKMGFQTRLFSLENEILHEALNADKLL